MDLLAARDAIAKRGDASVRRTSTEHAEPTMEFYKMGMHFRPFEGSASRQRFYLPTLEGSGENEVILYPNHLISIVMAKAAELPPGERAKSDDGPQTLRAVDRLAPF